MGPPLFEALIANAVFLCDADALLHWNSAAEEGAWGGLKTGPPRRHQIQPVEGPVLDPVQRKRILKGAAAFSRCGNVFFPLRQFFGLQSWTFSAAGFFPASAGFFLASDGFFPASDGFFPLPPKCIFSAAKVLLCCCKVFFCCFEFFPLRSGIFCWRFSRCGNSFFPLQGVFFLLPTCFFPFRCFFLLRTCVFRALREDKELENVESYTGRSPLVSWIAHGQIGDKGDQSLKQPSANEKLKHAALDAATCFNGSGYKRERQKE